MIRTLLLYDGEKSSPERIAGELCYMVDNSKMIELGSAPAELTGYDGIVLLFNFYGAVTAGRAKQFLMAHREELAEKRVIMLGIGYTDSGFTKYVVDAERQAGLANVAAVFISSTQETVRVGREIGRIMSTPVHAMDEEDLLEAVDKFIGEQKDMILATTVEGNIRCERLAYCYLADGFYVAAMGGDLFYGIMDNGRVAGIIEGKALGKKASPDERCTLRFQGDAQSIEAGSSEYQVLMTTLGYTDEVLEKLPVSMFLIRILPMRFEFDNPAFEAWGFDRLQMLETESLRQHYENGQVYANVTSSVPNPADWTDALTFGAEDAVQLPEIDMSVIEGLEPKQ